MFETHNGIVCVQAGWLYSEAGVLTKPNYDALVRRKQVKVLRRATYCTPALIEFDSLPVRFKEVIVSEYGDPTKKSSTYVLVDYILTDNKAVEYFKNYTLPSGEALPEKNIKEYTCNANILNAIQVITNETSAKRKALGGKKSNVWNRLAEVISELPKHTYPHSLPANVRRLKDKFNDYVNNGYQSLIHKSFCNSNSEKLSDSAKVWVISRWADRVVKCANTAQLLREYNVMAQTKGWKPLKEEKTLHNYLNRETVKHLWWGHRYGDSVSKEKFAYMHSTKLPTMRDSLWYSDGTKLNYWYMGENGKPETIQVYEVMDAYSEVLLGYHISKTEDYVAQYKAYKMAIQHAGHKPYQLGFDSQGGHKKLASGNFLTKISRIAIKTQPYNGKSKTIENAFYRLQSQFLKQDWFFTGQNITTKSLESKANREMVLANVKNLPTLEEVKKTYEQRRKEWNEAPHPKTGKPRLEMYRTSENPNTPEVNMWDMVDLFWVEREQPVTCSAYGISFVEQKEKRTYMVYTEDSLPDVYWLRNNIDKKFYIKFDPEDFSVIYLYEKDSLGLRFVCEARPKVEVTRGKQEQENWEAEYIKKIDAKIKESRAKADERMDAMLEEQGRLPEQYGLNSPKLLNVKTNHKKGTTTIGKVTKAESNVVVLEDNDEESYLDLM